MRTVSTLTYLRRIPKGATATDAARAMLGEYDVIDNQRKKAQRILDGLVAKGLATRTDPVRGGAEGTQPAVYFAVLDPS